jgi:acyl carrier protein
MSFDSIRFFVVSEFLAGQDPLELDLDQPLVTSGIVDSVGTMRLVLFLEQTYDIELDSSDIASDRLDTVRSIAALVESKLRARAAGE